MKQSSSSSLSWDQLDQLDQRVRQVQRAPSQDLLERQVLRESQVQQETQVLRVRLDHRASLVRLDPQVLRETSVRQVRQEIKASKVQQVQQVLKEQLDHRATWVPQVRLGLSVQQVLRATSDLQVHKE